MGGGNSFNSLLDNSLSIAAHAVKGDKAATKIGFVGSLEKLNYDLKDGFDKKDVLKFIDNVSYDIAGLSNNGFDWRIRKLLGDVENIRDLSSEAKTAVNNIKNNNYSQKDIETIIKNIHKHSGWI